MTFDFIEINGVRICIGSRKEIAQFFAYQKSYNAPVAVRFLGFLQLLFFILKKPQHLVPTYFLVRSRLLAHFLSFKLKRKVISIKPASYLIDLLENTVPQKKVHTFLGLYPAGIRKMLLHIKRPFPSIIIRGLISTTSLKSEESEIHLLMKKTKPEFVIIDEAEKISIEDYPPALYSFVEEAMRIYAKLKKPQLFFDHVIFDLLKVLIKPWLWPATPLILFLVFILAFTKMTVHEKVDDLYLRGSH